MRPNGVTFAGFLLTWMVPVETVKGNWPAAGAWLLAAGFFDVLDGVLARNGGFQSHFGAFWDSTLDRLSEAVVFGGFLLYYGRHQQTEAFLLAFGACVFSFLVSYTRARAEGLGVDCEVGVLPRPGRVALLALGFFASQPAAALALVAGLSFVTAVQRIGRVWRKAGKERRGY